MLLLLLLLQDKALLNCAGGGVCGTCIVEARKFSETHILILSLVLIFAINCISECTILSFQVVEGGEMLSPKNEVEKEKLRRVFAYLKDFFKTINGVTLY
jgi:ferredoxin